MDIDRTGDEVFTNTTSVVRAVMEMVNMVHAVKSDQYVNLVRVSMQLGSCFQSTYRSSACPMLMPTSQAFSSTDVQDSKTWDCYNSFCAC